MATKREVSMLMLRQELDTANKALKDECDRANAIAKALRESEDRYRRRELEMIQELQGAHLERRRLRESLEHLYDRHETLQARLRVLQAAIGVMSDDITENTLRSGHSMARDLARSRSGARIDEPGMQAQHAQWQSVDAQWNGDGCNRPTVKG